MDGGAFRNRLWPEHRIIPVRSDENRILTCFLEGQADCVRVHDLSYERSKGEWKLNVGHYEKLRLDPRWVAFLMSQLGLEMVMDRVERGMVHLAGRTNG